MYFVMLRHQNGKPLPLVNDNECPELYMTEEDAELAAEENLLGEHFGYEIYEWD